MRYGSRAYLLMCLVFIYPVGGFSFFKLFKIGGSKATSTIDSFSKVASRHSPSLVSTRHGSSLFPKSKGAGRFEDLAKPENLQLAFDSVSSDPKGYFPENRESDSNITPSSSGTRYKHSSVGSEFNGRPVPPGGIINRNIQYFPAHSERSFLYSRFNHHPYNNFRNGDSNHWISKRISGNQEDKKYLGLSSNAGRSHN